MKLKDNQNRHDDLNLEEEFWKDSEKLIHEIIDYLEERDQAAYATAVQLLWQEINNNRNDIQSHGTG